MADAAVTFLLENLSLVVRYYVDLIRGAEDELEQLKAELEYLKGFLCDVADRPKKEEAFKVIERQIRETVYDAEDVIDSCLTRAAQNQVAETQGVFQRPKPSTSVNLAQEVKSLREKKVKPMVAEAKGFTETESAMGSHTRVQETWTKDIKVPLIRQDKVVGFQDEEEAIIKYLNEETKELDVISIIGMPGLGKTTLAWKIYQNEKIQYEFPIHIWVNISQVFNRKDVLLKILKELSSEDMSSLDDQELAQKVRGHLEKGKFLLVMDDVWSADTWNDIRDALPMSNGQGKVLMTSRYTKVARHANRTREPHNLRFLTEDESWELLQLEVFGRRDGCPQELTRLGKLIADQCHGLPLALVVIGGVLGDQYSTTRPIPSIANDWNKVSGNVSSFYKSQKEQRISDIVALSYNRLSDELRNCFLYFGMFPEDYEIPAGTLIRLWIAEGFVLKKEGQSLEESAEENLMDLINRNLVMGDKINPNGKVKTCRVHDVMHAFCSSKAAITEQNLFQEIKMQDGVFEPPISKIDKYRRLCIHSDLAKFLSKKPKGKVVRSLLCFNRPPVGLDPKLREAIPDAFHLLRVLDSKSIILDQIPKGVTKIFHLRYITLSVDNLQVLPEAISKLWNLQTLIVNTTSRSLEVRANIWKMIQLRHVKTKAAITLANKDEGEASENLQTLSRLSPDDCTKDVLSRANKLKRLGIYGKLDTLFADKSLEILDRLEKLELVNDTFYESVKLRGLPQPSWFPRKLMQLTISATSLDWGNMSTLGKLDSLQVLKLKNNAFTGDSWDVRDAFPSLHFLLIENNNLVYWEASANHFPSLTYLVLKNCEKLKKIPFCLAERLQKLDIERVRRSAVESAREIEKERAKRGVGFKLSVGPSCE